MTALAIETFALSKEYVPGVRALDGLDLRVEKGEIFGFLGPNGAGKSTTIRLLLDLIRPTGGRAEILGFDCQGQSQEVRAAVGHLPGDVRLYPNMTGKQTVDFFRNLRQRKVNQSRVSYLAERLELNLEQKAGELSKGNRQKLGLLIALLDKPPVLLLDEPTSGLDPLLQHTVWDILREAATQGVTVFFSSHVMSEVEETCERVGILRKGRLAEVSTVDTLKARALRRIEARFAEKVPEPGEFDSDGVREVERNGNRVELEILGELDPVLKKLAKYEVTALESRSPTLDEILLAFYESAQ